MNQENIKIIKKIKTPYCDMKLVILNDMVKEFVQWSKNDLETTFSLNKKQENIIKELNDYFSFKIKKLKSPILLPNKISDFKKNVLINVFNIPLGETKSYSEIALLSGKPNAQRAVGTIMSQNKLMFYIPCHRVIKNNGNIGRYSMGDNFLKSSILNDEKNKYK